MPKTLKVIVKSPSDEYGRYEEIENSLEAMQKVVGGYIESVHLQGSTWLICNEDGKLLNLEPNMRYYNNMIVGTIFVCDVDRVGNMTDVSISLEDWKGIVNGNYWKDVE